MKTNLNETVRIIGGKYRGKKISFPHLASLRPTTNRIRETLFNWLMTKIQHAHCLDAFAGSGALGFEAFSRGAERVVLVEAHHTAYVNLKITANSFNNFNNDLGLSILHADVLQYLQVTNEKFDIIFLDPPFKQNMLIQCLHTIVQSNLLANGGLVYLESADKINIDARHWQEKKSKQAGQVNYGLYQKI